MYFWFIYSHALFTGLFDTVMKVAEVTREALMEGENIEEEIDISYDTHPPWHPGMYPVSTYIVQKKIHIHTIKQSGLLTEAMTVIHHTFDHFILVSEYVFSFYSFTLVQLL